jgi:hypothetical protein
LPKGYWIAHVDVTDPEGYKAYMAANGAVFAKYGARFLVRAGRNAVKAGAKLCESYRIGCDVALVSLGFGHVDMSDPVAFGHYHAPSTRTYSTFAAPSRSAFAS